MARFVFLTSPGMCIIVACFLLRVVTSSRQAGNPSSQLQVAWSDDVDAAMSTMLHDAGVIDEDTYNAPSQKWGVHIDRSKQYEHSSVVDNTLKYGGAMAGFAAGEAAGGLLGGALGRTAGMDLGEKAAEGISRIWQGHGSIGRKERESELVPNTASPQYGSVMAAIRHPAPAAHPVSHNSKPARDQFNGFHVVGNDPDADLSRLLHRTGAIKEDTYNGPGDKYMIETDSGRPMQPWLKHGLRFGTTAAGVLAGGKLGQHFPSQHIPSLGTVSGQYVGESAGITLGGRVAESAERTGHVSIGIRDGSSG